MRYKIETAIFVHWAVAVWTLAVRTHIPRVMVISIGRHNAIRPHAGRTIDIVHPLSAANKNALMQLRSCFAQESAPNNLPGRKKKRKIIIWLVDEQELYLTGYLGPPYQILGQTLKASRQCEDA